MINEFLNIVVHEGYEREMTDTDVPRWWTLGFILLELLLYHDVTYST